MSAAYRHDGRECICQPKLVHFRFFDFIKNDKVYEKSFLILVLRAYCVYAVVNGLSKVKMQSHCKTTSRGK